MPTLKAKTQFQVYSSPEPLLSPKPTKEEMCRLYGIDDHAFLAAQRRLERAEERNHLMIVVKLVLLMNANVWLNLPKNQWVRGLLRVNKC